MTEYVIFVVMVISTMGFAWLWLIEQKKKRKSTPLTHCHFRMARRGEQSLAAVTTALRGRDSIQIACCLLAFSSVAARTESRFANVV
jgi:hypothetical protein